MHLDDEGEHAAVVGTAGAGDEDRDRVSILSRVQTMLDKSQIAAASRSLRDHWRAGTKLGALETSVRPRDRIEAYAIQAALEQHSAGPLFGWKIAATSEAGQKHINVDGARA